jgi:dolichol kinase
MDIKHEFYRKSFHLLLILIPIIYYNLGRLQSLMLLLPITAIVVGFDYCRRKNSAIQNIFVKIFQPILRPHEIDGNKLCGSSWVAIAASINFLLFKEEIAITSFMILVISDTAAALIGKNFPSRPFFEKSFFGSLAFFISGAVLIISCGMFFHARTWFYLFGSFALFCTTMIEARPSLFKIDDNFIIPISFSVIMTFFDLVWNYNY